MSMEIEDRGFAVRLQLQGNEREIYKSSKITYTKAFLLACAELDVCKELPGGFDPLILCELKVAHRSTVGSWRGSSQRDPSADGSRESKWSSLQSIDCLPNVPEFDAVVLDQNIKETQKTGCFRLCKSENPYRPPHCHKVGSTKLEAEYLSEKIKSLEEMHLTSSKETRPREHNISCSDKDHEISIPSIPVIEHSGNIMNLFFTADSSGESHNFVKSSQHALSFLEACVAHEDKFVNIGSYKINLSINSTESNQEQYSRMFVKEKVGSYVNAKNSSSSTVVENAIPQYLAANVESDMKYSAKQFACGTEGLSSVLTNSSERHSDNLEIMQEDEKPNSEIQLSELHCSRRPNSVLRCSDERATRNDFSKPCEFPFVDALQFAGDGIATRPNQSSIMAADVAEQMEDNEITFEDVWSEVLARMQFEKEMDLTSVDEYGQTADAEVQVCLPNGDSLISIAYPSSCELSEGDENAEIFLPDENNLICIDNMIATGPLRLKDDENSVKDDTLTSNPTEKVAEGPETVDKTYHKTVSPFRDMKASLAHQQLHFQQIYRQNPCTDINAETLSLNPFDFQQAQMRLQMPFVDPMAPQPYSGVNWYSCTDKHYQPSGKEFVNFLVQYSLEQQPTTFPRQDNGLSFNVSPFDPHINQDAGYNRELDMIHISPLAYELTNPNLAAPNLGPLGVAVCSNQPAFNQFTDMGRRARQTGTPAAAWHRKNSPTKKLK